MKFSVWSVLVAKAWSALFVSEAQGTVLFRLACIRERSRRMQNLSSKQGRAAIGKFQVGPALVQPQPAESDGTFDSGAEVFAAAARKGALTRSM